MARDGSPLLMFSDWRQLPAMTDAVQAAGWTWRGVVVWHKRTGRPLRGEFRREAEFVIFASKGRLGYRGPRCLPGCTRIRWTTRKRSHLTSKPVELLRELMEVVPEGGTVLDPFIGGGSTAEAARGYGPNVYQSRTFPGLCGDYGPTSGKLRPKRKRRGAIRAFFV